MRYRIETPKILDMVTHEKYYALYQRILYGASSLDRRNGTNRASYRGTYSQVMGPDPIF
jgi:hypothetical protein